ncbi:MAG TPA: L-threonylcarbamoyladenylate synthase [Terracidiphilus sp.]|nr:L-threonylcarbamoyladenylate synthase [Terracidiphilus sp.]
MTTLRLKVDPHHLDAPESRAALAQAAEILRAGGLVALPTETVYGLGANALDADAVARIFHAKQRPSWDPVIVHIAGPVRNNAMLHAIAAEIPESARKLMEAFWPGPLTLLLPRTAAVPDAVTAGRPLVGVRMPAHPVAFELIRLAGVPVAAPSANVFGHISPTTAEHVLDDLDGRIDAILDAGPALHGVESTVLDPAQSPMVLYRPGALSADRIRAVADVDVIQFQAPLTDSASANEAAALPSPGVGIRHYAPRAQLALAYVQVAGSEPYPPAIPTEEAEQHGGVAALNLAFLAAARQHPGKRLGLMLPTGWRFEPVGGSVVFEWGNWDNPEELATRLYAGLRALDSVGCTVIVCPVPPPAGIGAAIRDRLQKAAFTGQP